MAGTLIRSIHTRIIHRPYITIDTPVSQLGCSMKTRGIMAFFSGILWTSAWLALVIGLCSAADALKFDASRIPSFMINAAAITSLIMAVWFWRYGFWRAWSRHAVIHDEKWAYCGDARPCKCNLPSVCLKTDCTCDKLHVCADPQCKCAKPKVCTSPKCKCDLPKAFTFAGKSTFAQ
jgi:hypothetical protein